MEADYGLEVAVEPVRNGVIPATPVQFLGECLSPG
jgi:hypothetical protein